MKKIKNGGFSLVEIMVAMVGISLVVLLLTSVLITSVRSAAAGQNRDYMLMGARSKMNELTADIWAILEGADVFTAPNGREFQRRWINRSTSAPFTVEVRVWDDNDTVLIRGIIQHECDVNVVLTGRPLIRFLDGTPTEPEAATINRDIQIVAANPAQPISPANPASPVMGTRLFTAIPTSSVAGRLRILQNPTTPTLQNSAVTWLRINDNDEIYINMGALPSPNLGVGNVLEAIVYFPHCSTPNAVPPADNRTTVRITFTAVGAGTPPASSGYTVHFDAQSGTVSPPSLSGATIILPTPERDGHTFTGWRTATETCGGSSVNARLGGVSYIPPADNTTLFACWTPIDTIRFNSNYGTLVPNQLVVRGNPTVRPPNPTRDDNTTHSFEFDEWLNGPNVFVFGYPIIANINLIARWKETPLNSGGNNNRTVTFNSNGGSAVSSQTVLNNSPIQQPPNPTRANSTFGGWYKESGLINPWNFATDVVSSNITLFAKWIGACDGILPFATSSGVSFSAGTERVHNGILWRVRPGQTYSHMLHVAVGKPGDVGATAADIWELVHHCGVPDPCALVTSWSNGIPYILGNRVSFAGVVWEARTSNQGQAPINNANGSVNTTHWQRVDGLICPSPDDVVVPVGNCDNIPAFVNQTYITGAVVAYKGMAWILVASWFNPANNQNNSMSPAGNSSAGVWAIHQQCFDGVVPISDRSVLQYSGFKQGDIVNFNGVCAEFKVPASSGHSTWNLADWCAHNLGRLVNCAPPHSCIPPACHWFPCP